jgi:IclR family pca regulon transcriptional regulator
MADAAHSTTQSLERGLAILSATAEHGGALSLGDLARLVALSKSTAHRYATTLVHTGYLAQDAQTKHYTLGPRALGLGFAAISSLELTQVAERPLQALADQTGYTVSMAVLDGADIVYVDHRRPVRAGFRLELDIHVGSRLPAYCTSMGKMLLSERDPASLRAILDRTDLARRGPKTITAREQLLTALAETARAGLAVNDEELAPGLRSIAAPVRGRSGEIVAAINIAVHLSAWNATIEAVQARLESPVRRTAGIISTKLGYLGIPVSGSSS